MSYTNSNGYDYCKECYKQKQFCTCQTSCSSGSVHQEKDNPCDQTFCEHNPSSQSIGEQEQQQLQQQGGLEQEQGPQIQDQIQEGQRQGPQTQEQTQGPQTQGNQQQGPQTQDQTELQDQTQGSQTQDQTENQNQAQGAQIQTQRHGDQTQNNNQTQDNNQTISTPVDVDGVTVNVKCGDCKPTIFPSFPFEFFKKHKNMNHSDCGGEDMENCDCQEKNDKCSKDCNCCVRNLADLLNKVRQFQTTITNPTVQQIAVDIYFSVVSNLSNPTENQVITDIVDCSIVRFKSAGQATVVPNTTVQLCDVAGICATISTNPPTPTPNIFQFLLQQANIETEDCSCKKKNKPCNCPCCATGIGEELRCTANFGLQLNVFIKGLTTPLSLFVLKVKDCLAYFVDNISNPTEICVFSLCSITGFTVVSQTI